MRAMTLADHARVAQIERAAGETFRSLGMDVIADDDPFSMDELRPFVTSGLAWITDGETAYLVALEVDGGLHIEQVSVDPAHRGHGAGRKLIDHAEQEARRRGLNALTLTTFRDVPWNAPYYARLGFQVVAEPGAGLAAIRRHEADLGLDRWPRVVMSRAV